MFFGYNLIVIKMLSNGYFYKHLYLIAREDCCYHSGTLTLIRCNSWLQGLPSVKPLWGFQTKNNQNSLT